ncbi:uncharacterized protein MONOS_12732 [Monocercomonoides exilis]|uniref:uncharacterized protein n=1 Tax=Monocercomonoides exilis TaxID=2049356 RepID=UPI003559D7CB|nr:hypothetical protein MONOS_12732 [Monocercomonoides exilis]|eukprot:MONOS_12732.1-p1 / transcript=MONOS_12732.1 / gene=MONOS_12732 / organism=Monocercomonoides_exilis_PA203 / gene_product=unspecified product / transcript_product=unspecified product / location=Mono_scaffold00726:13079-13401(+) / protein_length=89 / sequence_SO=supercontig / SO=protein_coding / is_pseudo=false
MKELKTLTDIGLNILCEAKVPDLSTLMVDVGFGTCVEMTHTEILSYIPKKISILTASVADLESKIVAQQTNIRIVTAGMAEMKRELKCG